MFNVTFYNEENKKTNTCLAVKKTNFEIRNNNFLK